MPKAVILLLGVLLGLAPIAPVQAQAGYRVAIIDRFYPPPQGFASAQERLLHGWLYGMIDVDQDRQREPYYHGDLVRLIAAHPRLSFLLYPIRDQRPPLDEILQNLKNIRARLSYQYLDALLLAWESSTLISAFEQPLQRAHAADYKATLKGWGAQEASWRATHAIILELEALVQQGVRVFTIAGNGGRGMVNTFSFAEGVVTVGAQEPELANFIANNAFVTTYAKAAYQLTRLDDAQGRPLGYDIDGDDCIDIPLQRLTSYGKPQHTYPRHPWPLLKGSSFAASAALKRALVSHWQTPSCVAPAAAPPQSPH